MLTLDTYNEVMHYFADPETTGGQGAGFGFEGDFEFNVLDLQDEKITLKGRKTGSTMTMTPMPVSMSWDDYIVALKEEESAISKHTRIRYQTADNKYDGRINGRTLEVFSEVDGEQVTTSYPFIFNLMGVTFYKPLELGDERIDGLVYNPDMADGGAFIPVNDGAGALLRADIPDDHRLPDGQKLVLLLQGVERLLQEALGQGGGIPQGCRGQHHLLLPRQHQQLLRRLLRFQLLLHQLRWPRLSGF